MAWRRADSARQAGSGSRVDRLFWRPGVEQRADFDFGQLVTALEPRFDSSTLLFAGYERSSRTAQGLLAAVVQQRLTTPTLLLDELVTMRPLRRAALFRGVLRDIVCNEVPMVFRDGKPYAICAFIGNWLFLIMGKYGVSHDFALWSSCLFISGLRLLTWKFDMRMGR